MSNAIEVRKLNKHFGNRQIVKDLSLTIEQGKICGFLGPNGSGKTTSIRMLCGLLRPDSGTGHCLGHDLIDNYPAIKKQTGYMTQHFSLWKKLTVRANLTFLARLHMLSAAEKRIDAVLEQMGLTQRQYQLAGNLSGGWKQRLALAAALLHQPRLLLLDEPTAGVDPNARREFWHILHQLAEQGITILVSTHYMDEAERCHQLAYLCWGTLLATGDIPSIIARQNLQTWQVRGENIHRLENTLRSKPGIQYLTRLGNVLHVTGNQGDVTEQTLRAYSNHYQLTSVETGLEDIFSHLLNKYEQQGG
ncbi:multidrug ABC transporter ATP-binding protein [Mixta theicola]|uniref:Multidrug ABC transporter ATP-binding protein n=1 Tax=Mixta theicola TaxID=1458355 RepID=A0A2K1QA77_9GAMM|nr:ABC transporter ATP-binding protein [Mixta theicola]PNS11925.1 multidrug ABC transporter ATP-binding protein [Mixta theicola]GLR07856.1 multidrug ABC transporter ATP-binding protein [Mixta theicola]